MKIYIVERDTPSCKPEPEVFIEGNIALETVRTEYNTQMKELGITQEKSDARYDSRGCFWNFDNDSYIGDCLIDRDIVGDRWEWRITEHEVEVN